MVAFAFTEGVVLLLAFVVVVQALVLVEVIKQIAQLRFRLNLDDRPMLLSLGEHAGDRVPAEIVERGWFGNAESDGLLVLLSSECLTCHAIASGMHDVVRDLDDRFDLVVALEGRGEALAKFVQTTGIDERLVVVDDEHRIGDATGVTVRPSAIVVRDGRLVEAAALATAEQLRRLLSPLETDRREAIAAAT
jgi:hypothetical protein